MAVQPPPPLIPASLATAFVEHEHRLNRLAGDDRQWVAEHMPEALDLWVGAISKRARPVIAQETEIFRFTVNSCSLEQMIVACAFNWANDHITSERPPITADQVGEWEARYFDEEVKFLEATRRVKTDDTENPWTEAQIGHLLAHGEKYPDEQRKFPIFGVGSVAQVYGDPHVPYLNGGRARRLLSLYCLCIPWWPRRSRFLAVRRVSVPQVSAEAAPAA